MKTQQKIAGLLKHTMGLDVATVGGSALEHAVRSRMNLCGALDAEAYWERLRNSETELQELIEAVVVPETWFFRDREAFTALAKIVTTEWLPVHSARALRVLSVPCSTGEEPYSIAMTLLDAGLSPHAFRIDAMDISARALAFAMRGLFGKNSFRGRQLDFRERYFRPIGDRHEIFPIVRERVRFEQANLLAANFLSGVDSYDVIFCRNVLIYLDAPTQERVIKTLDRLLASDGFLFVGPAEAYLARGSGFISANQPRAFAYRKTSVLPREPASIREIPRKKIKPSPRRSVAKLRPKIERQSPPATPVAADILDSARRLADAGKLREAARACEAHLRESGTSPAALYLLALVRDALGDDRGAADCYRKVVYLEPNHAEALMHLALLAEKRGDSSAAQRLQLRSRRVEEIAVP